MCQRPQGGASGPRTTLNVWLPGGLSPETQTVFTLGGTPGSLPEPSFCLFTNVGQSHLSPTIGQAQNSDPVGTWGGTRPLPQVSISKRFDSPRVPDGLSHTGPS